MIDEDMIDETLAESFPASDPPSWTLGATRSPAQHSIEHVMVARPRDIGAFSVRRTLPTAACRHVGPFVFFDHMGPIALAPGAGMDVRPHPHIGLATVTYLFEGEIVHRDSLGSHQTIRPRDVNWMVAGRGVVHSERSADAERARGPHIHGIQSWVALPLDQEESPPQFEHHDASAIPRIARAQSICDVIAGSAFGARSPVSVRSPTLYVHAQLERGARLHIDDEHEERAVYVVEGSIGCDGQAFGAGAMIVFRPGDVSIDAQDPCRLMLLGGAKLGERHIFWNFVSSSKERIDRAKEDWQNDRFPKVPGDESERIPLP